MIELRTLGTLEVRHRDEPGTWANTLQAKRLVLLACLAAGTAGGFRRRDTLLGLFWPELDLGHARGALRQALYTMRQALGEGAIVTRGESEIRLDHTVVSTDARRFETACRDGHPAEALAMYQGDFLEGVFVSDASPELDQWMAAERVRLRRLAAHAAWSVAECASGSGDTGEHVRQAVALSGDDEPALRRGMILLDCAGDRAGALAVYEEFARRVSRDLGVGPSAETERLAQSIRRRRLPFQGGIRSPRAGLSGG